MLKNTLPICKEIEYYVAAKNLYDLKRKSELDGDIDLFRIETKGLKNPTTMLTRPLGCFIRIVASRIYNIMPTSMDSTPRETSISGSESK